MSHYAHFTTEEQELSRVMRAQGISDRVNSRLTYELQETHIPQNALTENMPNAEKIKDGNLFLKMNRQKNVVEKLEQRWISKQIV